MKVQVEIDYDVSTGEVAVKSSAPTPPITYGALVAAFEAMITQNIVARLNPSGIVQPTDEDLSKLRGSHSGT